MLVITLLALLFLSSCCCCRCCRQSNCWFCWREPFNATNMRRSVKIFVIVMSTLYASGIAADIIFALKFKGNLVYGIRGLACETFVLADNLINGVSGVDPDTGNNNVFVGTENLSTGLDNLGLLAAVNSPVWDEVLRPLDQVSDIKFAVNEFLAWLGLIDDLLGDPVNRNPGRYSCAFCETCCRAPGQTQPTQLQLAIADIRVAVARTLNELHATLQGEIRGSNMDSVRGSIDSAKTKVADLQSQVNKLVEDGILSNEPLLDTGLFAADLATTLIVSVMAGIPSVALGVVIFYGVLRSDQSTYMALNTKPRNPCCACTGWGLEFLLAILIFIIAGIFGLIAFFEGSLCAVLGDIDYFAQAGVRKLTSDAEIQKIATTCLASTGSGDLLSSVQVSSGKTAGDMLDMSQSINNQFDALSASLVPGSKFSDTHELVTFLENMQKYSTLYLMGVNQVTQIRNDPLFQPSSQLIANIGQINFERLFHDGVAGVPDCEDRTDIALTGDVGSSIKDVLVNMGESISAGQTSISLKGATTFSNALRSAGVNIGISPSAICRDFASLGPHSNTSPLDALMTFKTDVWTHRFRCDSIVVARGPNGAAVTSPIASACDYSGWVQHVNDLHSKVTQYARNVDTVMTQTKTNIVEDMREAVLAVFQPPIDELKNGFNCKFLRERVTGIHNALCWQQAPGLIGSVITWLVFGGLMWICILIQFVIWRHLRDNLSIWLECRSRGALMQTPRMQEIVKSVRIPSRK